VDKNPDDQQNGKIRGKKPEATEQELAIRRVLYIAEAVPPCMPLFRQHYRGATVSDIEYYLGEKGIHVSRRTIQRDLDLFKRMFQDGIQEDMERGQRGAAWCWAPVSPFGWHLPGLNIETRLALFLGRQILSKTWPTFPFQESGDSWKTIPMMGSADWQWWTRIRVIDAGIPRIPPEMNDRIVQTLLTGYLLGKKIEISYNTTDPAYAGQPLLGIIDPLGIVIRDGRLHMVCRFGTSAPRYISFQRVGEAKITAESVTTPEDFNLDEFIQQEFLFPVDKQKRISMLHVVLRFTKEAARTVLERPIGVDQEYRVDPDKGDGYLLVSATVHDTKDLRWWINGYGPSVEVLEPPSLRKEVMENARHMLEMYSS
jgi:predicted DNA-binding transcriptional regulator YafY